VSPAPPPSTRPGSSWLRLLWLAPALAYAALIFWLSHQSNPLPLLGAALSDKLLHGVEYAGLAALLVLGLTHVGTMGLRRAALLSILLFAVIRQRGFTRPEAIWMALTSFVIGLASIPERRLGILRQPGEGLLACVAGGPDRYLPLNLDDLLDDLGPNLILYAPLGFILAVRGLSLRWTLVTALALSGTVELYQALFTARVCAPRDLIANATGALLGAATVHVLTRRDARPVATPIPPKPGVGETSTMAPLDTLSVED